MQKTKAYTNILQDTRIRNSIEIMSPCGTFESLMGAIGGGADSVYFGIGRLNMRSASTKNFTIADLPEIARICAGHNVRPYLALNTVIYDDDLREMKQIADAVKQSNISAIIASDIAVIDYARKIGVEIHISTQQNVSNFEAVKYFSNFADVIVLARELSLEQTAHIVRQIINADLRGPSGRRVRIEVFVHGALCMAISGKCYMSLHEFDKSANRGECLHTCRRSYTVRDTDNDYELEIDNEYIMSPKDLSAIAFVDKIIEAGVTVMKIEGRGRSADYVKKTTQCYDEAVKAYFAGEYTPGKIKQWEERLASVFNRGFWDGYYLGRKLGEWSGKYGSRATKKKVHVGIVTNFYKNISVAEILVQASSIEIDDEIIITGPTSGVVECLANEIRKDESIVTAAAKGETVSIKAGERVRRGDKVYKLMETARAGNGVSEIKAK